MLIRLKAIEAAFGRRIGQRWGARTLDLDILLWSGGAWSDDRLTIPHPAMAERPFVLGPLTRIAPGWRHPLAARSIRQLAPTLPPAKPVDRAPLPHQGGRPPSHGRPTATRMGAAQVAEHALLGLPTAPQQ